MQNKLRNYVFCLFNNQQICFRCIETNSLLRSHLDDLRFRVLFYDISINCGMGLYMTVLLGATTCLDARCSNSYGHGWFGDLYIQVITLCTLIRLIQSFRLHRVEFIRTQEKANNQKNKHFNITVYIDKLGKKKINVNQPYL